MEVRRPHTFAEASIEAMGVGSAAVSRHFDEQIKDDWVNEDHILYPEQMDKLVQFYKNSISLFVSPARGYDTVIGTRWSFNDLIQHILDTSTVDRLGKNNPFAYHSTVRSAIEEGEPIFPINGLGEPEFTKEHLDAILESQGPYIFSCQYLNNPVHEDSKSFLPSWNRYYTTTPGGLRCFTTVDPATERGDSFSAIVTIGASVDRSIYVLEYTKANLGTDELIDEIIRQHIKYKSRVGIEAVAFQKVLLHPLREAMRKLGISFGVKELRPIGNQRKQFRVAGILQPRFANGSVFIRQDMEDLKKELGWFPALQHYDLLDALSYAVQMATYPDEVAKQIRGPFDVDVILEELEARHRGNVSEPWIWNKRGHDQSSVERIGSENVLKMLMKPPFSKTREEAERILQG